MPMSKHSLRHRPAFSAIHALPIALLLFGGFSMEISLAVLMTRFAQTEARHSAARFV
jgi:hypothetical protein